ncbi:MAG: cytidine deaminase [Flavobacteriales bacterium]|nr:cytidine deaminase [Flavobacteriales bacterium]
MKRQITLSFEEVDSIDALSVEQKTLVEASMKACHQAYAPYSNFRVGAAVQLENGSVVTGSNKENASFPAGTCAERNVINYVGDHHPGERVLRMALSADPKALEMTGVLTPCGICRQVICELEKVQGSSIELLLHSPSGKVLIVPSGKDLLPFHFYLPQLKK